MNFEEFKERVKDITPSKRWHHVLPAVPEWHRERFISLVNLGMIPPKAYELIDRLRNFSDEEFEKHLNVIKGNRQ